MLLLRRNLKLEGSWVSVGPHDSRFRGVEGISYLTGKQYVLLEAPVTMASLPSKTLAGAIFNDRSLLTLLWELTRFGLDVQQGLICNCGYEE